MNGGKIRFEYKGRKGWGRLASTQDERRKVKKEMVEGENVEGGKIEGGNGRGENGIRRGGRWKGGRRMRKEKVDG